MFYELFYKFDSLKLVDFAKLKNKIAKEVLVNTRDDQVMLLFDRLVSLILGLNGPLQALFV